MKKGIIGLLVFFLTNGFAQDNSFKPKYFAVLDSPKGELLLQQCSRDTPKKISDYWKLSAKDISILEIHFLKVKNVAGPACCLSNGTLGALDDFGFQYIGVTIDKKKYIYINAFYLDIEGSNTLYGNWKTEPVVICDGGDHYWGVLFDLTGLEFNDLSVNGV